MLRRLVILLLVGCSSGLPASNQDLAPVADLSVPRDAAPMGCTKASDCRLFSSYCGGCSCLSLPAGDPDPACSGMMVSCLTDPCTGMTGACSPAGKCVAQ
jgi:hypothetical protein